MSSMLKDSPKRTMKIAQSIICAGTITIPRVQMNMNSCEVSSTGFLCRKVYMFCSMSYVMLNVIYTGGIKNANF